MWLPDLESGLLQVRLLPLRRNNNRGWSSKVEDVALGTQLLHNGSVVRGFESPTSDLTYWKAVVYVLWNIYLEIDGKQHEYRKDHDKIRDKILKDNGFNVYRIKWKSINSEKGKNYIENEINKFLDFYTGCGVIR